LHKPPLFHLAFPVYNLDQTKDFYTKVLDCKIGRKSNKWIDFNFYGHQITAHLTKNVNTENKINNEVDGKNVPIRHFGLIMDWRDWHNIKDKLIFNDIEFIIEPYIRFQGEVGEQATLFFSDPSFNYIELKSFKNKEMVFAS
tara:strand:- start:2091 stop:2516 length:426 start_codon:yes stop_codon:yes gene_type:complete